jgi:hypothetical protein
MKNMIGKALLAILCLTVVAGLASAAPVDCTTITNAATMIGPGSMGCSVAGSGLVFTNFQVSSTGNLNTPMVGFTALAGTGVGGNEVDLGFQYNANFTGGVETGDMLVFYQVLGSITGVDGNIQGVDQTPMNGGQVQILETVCAVAFVNGNCPQMPVAQLTVTSINGSPGVGSTTFTAATNVFIKKDISFSGASASEFTNSAMVPEPAALGFFGTGLLALGLIGRRLRK